MNINSRTSKINFTGFASGAIASFIGLREAPVKVRSYINSIQSGSGIPSPDNIRPIIGRDSATITANSVDHMISLGDTYYGGSLDVTTGLLTVTWEGGDIKDFDWQYSQTLGYFSVELADSETGTASDMPNIKTSVFETIPYNERTQHSNVVIDLRNQAKYVEVRNAGYTDVTTFKQAFAGQTLIYKLATPINIQLTPTQISQIIGSNSISSDSGNVEVYYVTI